MWLLGNCPCLEEIYLEVFSITGKLSFRWFRKKPFVLTILPCFLQVDCFKIKIIRKVYSPVCYFAFLHGRDGIEGEFNRQ